MNYIEALRLIHGTLAPENYIEIGCREGKSLSLSRCPSLAIDPDFEIRVQIEAPVQLYKQTSDTFFAEHDLRQLLGSPFDLAFIDGMHNAEFVLRDFINLERHAGPYSVILIDDVLPEDIGWTTRERRTKAWTGDVYKIIPLLRTARPDLKIEVFDIDMKGLALVSGLNPENRTLSDALRQHEDWLKSNDSALFAVESIRDTLAPHPVDTLARHCQSLEDWRRGLRRDRSPDQTAHALYLDLLKRSLLNEIYLDDELRLLYLRECLSGKETFDYAIYHEIRITRAESFAKLKASRQIGQFYERTIHNSGFSHTMIGRERLDGLHECLDRVIGNGIPGDLMECGVWRGGACIFMAGYARAYGQTSRRVFVADSFEGLPKPSHPQDSGLVLDKERYPELAISQETVAENFAAYDLLGENVVFLKGWFKDTLHEAPTDQIALLRLDGDLYESTMDALKALYDKVAEGGVVIIDDYGAIKACRQAVQDFFDQRDEPQPVVTEIDWTGVYWIKQKAQSR